MIKMDELWEQIKDLKRILITIIVISLIFIVAKYSLFSETKSSAEKIRFMILGGVLQTLCVAPEENIFMTEKGPVAVIAGSEFNLNGLWSIRYDSEKKDRYIAIVTSRSNSVEVLKIKKQVRDGYARNNREACLEYEKNSSTPISMVVDN